MTKGYKTISSASQVELIINKSRFIGRCFPIADEGEALTHLERIRKQHYDATHNCYAYRIGESSAARYSDDGEPGGTAGLPMMEVLTKSGVTGLICIVTRYFGGVLLGAGGLVRAYSRAASEAVQAARPILMLPARELFVTLDYPRFAALESFLKGLQEQAKAQLADTVFTECVTLTLRVLESEAAALCAAITERTDGRAAITLGQECYMEALC